MSDWCISVIAEYKMLLIHLNSVFLALFLSSEECLSECTPLPKAHSPIMEKQPVVNRNFSNSYIRRCADCRHLFISNAIIAQIIVQIVHT